MLVFWDKVNELNVPVYLHPREPLEGPARGIYTGYESLIGSAWGFAQETAVHAIRLMMSGLFDRYPNLNLVLGHLGEGAGTYAAAHSTSSLSSAFRLRFG